MVKQIQIYVLAGATQKNFKYELVNPISILSFDLNQNAGLRVATMLSADKIIPVLDVTTDGKFTKSDSATELTLNSISPALVTVKSPDPDDMICRDFLYISVLSTGATHCMFNIEYEDRFEIPNFESKDNRQDIRQVGRDQIGDATQGSEFYQIGDKRKVVQ